MKIIIGSDHAGFELKDKIITHLKSNSKYKNIEDVGCNSTDSVDYPDYAKKVAEKISDTSFNYGILICGTGIGMCIAANKFKNVRAALCHNIDAAKATRAHNNANILCLGARTMDKNSIMDIVDAFLSTEFEGGRHQRRVDKIE